MAFHSRPTLVLAAAAALSLTLAGFGLGQRSRQSPDFQADGSIQSSGEAIAPQLAALGLANSDLVNSNQANSNQADPGPDWRATCALS